MRKYKSFFPWFGSKTRVASLIWDKVGKPSVYVEPFAGSLAVMLENPWWEDTVEVVNDLDGMVTNAWRSIKFDPEATKHYANWPTSELDLHARSTYCESQREELEAILRSDPEHYDPKLAGWWMWGMSTGIGDTFIAQKKSIPRLMKQSGTQGRNFDWDTHFEAMSHRLRHVRIACGDWKRVVKPSVTERFAGPTLVFLDPPYAREQRHDTYAHESYTVASEVQEWCIENQDDPDLMIVLAGYEGDYDLTSDWEKVEWKAHGGLSKFGEGQGKENARLERLWFSPSCARTENVLDLFGTQSDDGGEDS